MDNKEINISDILPPAKVEKFSTADTVVPQFIKTSAYEAGELMEETIQKDWNRLIDGLSDYVLAEQLTEYELRGIGKPVAENYSEYFHDTLKDVRKNRKKAEQKLFKFIPRHSQLGACEFFEVVEEQCAKEKEARERAIEIYPPCGVEKLERKDVARAGIKKEAAAKWKAGQRLYCKTLTEMNKCIFAVIVYVNEDDKTYSIKVSGTMYPTYYAWDDAHATFDAVDKRESQDSDWSKMKGLTLRAQDANGIWQVVRKSTFLPELQIKARALAKQFPLQKVEITEDPSDEKFSF
jgi:hypothetical protein